MRPLLLQHPRLSEIVLAWCAEAQQLEDHVTSGLVPLSRLPNHLAVFEECLDDLQPTDTPQANYPTADVEVLAATVRRLREVIRRKRERVII